MGEEPKAVVGVTWFLGRGSFIYLPHPLHPKDEAI